MNYAFDTGLLILRLCLGLTLAALNAEPLGFRADDVLVLAVQPKYSGSELGMEYFDELVRRLRRLPGVAQVSIADGLPMRRASSP